jgi:heptosyltransferase-3
MQHSKIISPERVERILIIKLRHIGDVLLTVPTIRVIKSHLPNARISALVSKGTEPMLTGSPLLEEVIGVDRSLGLRADLLATWNLFLWMRERCFDMALDFTGGERPAFLAWMSGAPIRLGWKGNKKRAFDPVRLFTRSTPCDTGTVHEVLKNLHLIGPLGLDANDLRVDLHWSREEELSALGKAHGAGLALGKPWVHIHPTSRWMFKSWSTQNVAEIVRRLIATGEQVLLTCGPGDRECASMEAIRAEIPRGAHFLAGALTLKELAVLLGKAKLFVGVDSAPMHMAAAVGTPVTALFGPSGAFSWGPWDNDNPADQYLNRNGFQTSGPHRVLQRDWPCIPCGRDGCGGSKQSRCLMDLSVDEVWEAVRAQLQCLKGQE